MFRESLKQEILNFQKDFPEARSALIPALWRVQEEYGYVSSEACGELAPLFDCSAAHVKEVLSFYTMFYQKPMGKHQIRVCKTLSCWLLGAQKVVSGLKKELNVELGEATPDKKYSLEVVECLGACDLAPVVQVNEKQYGKVTPEAAVKLVEGLK